MGRHACLTLIMSEENMKQLTIKIFKEHIEHIIELLGTRLLRNIFDVNTPEEVARLVDKAIRDGCNAIMLMKASSLLTAVCRS